MTSYIISGSAMIPVGKARKVETETPNRFTLNRARNATWAFVNFDKLPKRSWQLDMNTCNDSELQNLEALGNGAYGFGPFGLISCDAHGVNVLTPEQTMFTGQNTVLVQLPGGGSQPGLSGAGALITGAPVAQGYPVTVSAYLVGTGASLSVALKDVNGATVGTSRASSLKGSAGWVSVSFPDVTGALTLNATALNSVTMAAPQVTWTSATVPFHHGRGAKSVVAMNAGVGIDGAWAGSVYANGKAIFEEVG